MPLDPLTAESDLDPLEIFGTLLSSWQGAQDRDALQGFMDGVRTAALNALEGERYTIDSMGLNGAPLLCCVPWVPLTLLASELTDAGVALYGQPNVYGGGLIYGQPSQARYRWTIDGAWKSFDYIVDRIYRPTMCVDASQAILDTDADTIEFIRNPFDLLESVTVNGPTGPDQVLRLWARNVQVDLQALYYRFGAQIGLDQPAGGSTASYRGAVIELERALQKSFSTSGLRRGIAAAAGVPIALGAETVERIDALSGATTVTTNANVYRFVAGSTVLVGVGDEVVEGQPLTDTIVISDFSDQNTQLPDLPAILLPGADIAASAGPLAFPNVQDVWRFYYPDGTADVRCTVLGSTADVEAFWADVHTRGLAGTTLAARLGIVTPADVSSVNPMEFVIRQLIGANLVVVRVKPEFFQEPVGSFYARLPDLLPRWVRFLVHQDVGQTPAQVYDTSGGSDAVSVYPAVYPSLQLVGVATGDATLLDFTPSLNLS